MAIDEAMERVIPGRVPVGDLCYGSRLVEKLINYVMLDGKKTTARKIVYQALALLEKRQEQPALEVFYKAMSVLFPDLETRSRRVGGSSYQVPYEVPEERRKTLALRWLVKAARARGERTMAGRLAGELSDALQRQGKAYERRQEVHRMAEANRPFAHYRW